MSKRKHIPHVVVLNPEKIRDKQILDAVALLKQQTGASTSELHKRAMEYYIQNHSTSTEIGSESTEPESLPDQSVATIEHPDTDLLLNVGFHAASSKDMLN